MIKLLLLLHFFALIQSGINTKPVGKSKIYQPEYPQKVLHNENNNRQSDRHPPYKEHINVKKADVLEKDFEGREGSKDSRNYGPQNIEKNKPFRMEKQEVKEGVEANGTVPTVTITIIESTIPLKDIMDLNKLHLLK